MGALCAVGEGDVCGQLMTCITGGIQGNLERDSGEVDPHLSEKLSHSSSSPSSSSSEDDSSKGTEQRVSSILTNSMGGSWLNNSVHMAVFILHLCMCLYLHYVHIHPSTSRLALQVQLMCSTTQQAGDTWKLI